MSLPESLEVKPNGTVTYYQVYDATISQPLNLSEFPLEKHRFKIRFSAVVHPDREVRFVPGNVQSEEIISGGGISNELSLPDWEIVGYQSLVHPFEPVEGVRTAGFVFEFIAKRRFLYYL
jgi:hypothetical protein